jgi:hypothetical protein
METIAIIGVVAAVIGVVAFLLITRSRKRAQRVLDQSPLNRALRVIKEIPPVVGPGGIKFYFEEGTDRNTFSMQACADGVEKTFEKSECAGYPVNRRLHEIKIAVLNSVPDSEGNPALKYVIGPLSGYWNSEWDKATCPGEECEHWILAAAAVATTGAPYGDGLIIPHHAGNEEHLARVCEYEMEHCALAYYDQVKYDATKVHGAGQGHPLISECEPSLITIESPAGGINDLCVLLTK